jgi:taurine dioxygenase
MSAVFDTAATATTPLALLPVAGRIGAEVRGVRLTGDAPVAVDGTSSRVHTA